MNQEKNLITQLQSLNTTLSAGIEVNEPDLTDIKTNTANTATNTGIVSGCVTASILAVDTKSINGSGTATGSGNIDTGTQRISIANDDTIKSPIHTTGSLVDPYITGTTKCVVMGGAQLDTKFAPITLSNTGYIQDDLAKINGASCEVNSGNNSAGVQRVCLATNDLNTAYLRTNNVILSGSTGNHAVCTRETGSTLKCGFGVGLQRQDFATAVGWNAFITTGSGNLTAAPTYTNPSGDETAAFGCPRVCIATDDVNIASIKAIQNKSYDELTARMGNKTGISYASVTGEGITIDTVSQTLFSTAHTLNRNLSNFPHAGVIISVASTSALDTIAGTGAQIVFIEGLDASYNYQTDTLALNGTTKVDSAKTYTSITRFRVVQVGSTGFNQGDLYIGAASDTFTAGIPNTDIYFQMGLLHNAALCASFTVPAGYSFLPVLFGASCDATSAQTVRFDVYVRSFTPDIHYRVASTYVSNATTQFRNDCTAAFREKATVYIKASTASGTCSGYCSFQGVLLNNATFPNTIFL